MNVRSVAKFLREERERKGISRVVLARKAGVHSNTIARMETAGNCTLYTLMRIISIYWDDMAAFGEDYTYWEGKNEQGY